MKVFISHSSKEANIAEELCKALENGGNKCFIAPRDIRSGYEYPEEIANGIDSADVVLLLLSRASNKSPHVLREIERAVTKSVPILVYKIEEVELTKSMEYFLMTRQWMESGKNSYEDVVRCVNSLGKTKSNGANAADEDEGEKDKKSSFPIVAVISLIVALVAVIGIVLIAVGNMNRGTADSQMEQETAEPVTVQLGDTIAMGAYNGEDIYWRVLKISEDGTEAVLVARDILTVKAYDAPESGRFNHDGVENYFFAEDKVAEDMELQAYVQGDSSWAGSCIRTWLNSASENVTYEGQAPTSFATAEGTNGYHNEKGFLCNFTEDELAAIKETNVETKGNALSEDTTVITQDKVFLLSMDELAWFEEANVSMMATPTESAASNNKTSWYQNYCLDYGVEYMMWWLREPVEETASMCYLVGNGYHEENIYTWEVGVECFGIRPAMTVDLTSECIKVQ